MGNLFVCHSPDSNGYVILGFFIGMNVLFVAIGAFLQYFGRVTEVINVKSKPFILTVISLYLMFQSLLFNSYLSPCGGNLTMFVLIGIQLFILYAMLNKKWQLVDEFNQTYSQV